MLEQAIIDAEALKEAAVKTAEQTILEKYSTEIKDAVSSLLEQEEDPFAEEDPMMGGEEAEESEGVADQLALAATDGENLCACPDDGKEVTLDLDQLIAAAGAEEEGIEGDEAEVAGTEEELFEIDDAILIAEEEKAAKEDFDGDNKIESPEEEWKGSRKKAIEKSEEKEKKKNESLEFSTEQLENIIEELVVDLENVPSGDNFKKHPTESEYKQGLNVALAKEQDTAFAEEQEELRKAIKKLQEQVKSQKLQMNKQKKDYNNLKSVAIKAGKKLEEVNFSNAKLIYMNRILESDSLNERQKDKLVEAISKVGSVEEAKIVFDTLKENLSSKSRSAPKTLNEAVSRNNSLILKSNNEKQPANQSQVDRLKKLAGII